MGELCLSGCGGGNTGTSNCDVKIGGIVGFLFQKLRNGSNVRNGIPTNAVFDQADLDAMINDTDASERLYPFRNISGLALDQVTSTLADATTITTQLGQTIIVNDARVRSWSAQAYYSTPSYAKKVKNLFSCGSKWGVYLVDVTGKIIGVKGTNIIYPLAIETFNSGFNWSAPDTLNGATFTFNESVSNNDADIVVFTNITADVLGASGLIDVTGVLGIPGTTTISVTLTVDAGTAEPIYKTGLVQADFAVKKVSDDTNITIASVAETSDGVYLITLTGSTGLSAYIDITDDGFDYSQLKRQTFTFA